MVMCELIWQGTLRSPGYAQLSGTFCLVVLSLSKAHSSDPPACFPGSALLSVVKSQVGSLLARCRVHIRFSQILQEPNSLEPSGLKKAGAGHGNGR